MEARSPEPLRNLQPLPQLTSLPKSPLPQVFPITSAGLGLNYTTTVSSIKPVVSAVVKPSSASTNKTKDGLIRMLLQSNPLQLSRLTQIQGGVESMEEDKPPGYIARLGGSERKVELIMLDHAYAKPWNWKPESSFCKPTRTLFVPRVARNVGGLGGVRNDDEFIDVVSDPVKPVPPYDPQQARKVMDECDRFVSFANPRHGYEQGVDLVGWEENVVRDGWTDSQKRLLNKIVRVLHQDRLARLALDGVDNEPVLRRLAVDKTGRRARAVLSAPPTNWDTKLVQWLHATLTEVLPRPYLAAWIDVLQCLRSKVPGLVDRMMAGQGVGSSLTKQITNEGMGVLIKRPWDPAASSLIRRKPGRLPGNPVLVVAPPGPTDPRLYSKRMRLWNNQLGCLGKVIVINMPAPKGEIAGRTPVNQYLYQMVSATLGKVREIKHTSGDRPLVLLGWGPGAAIAAHVAGIEKLAGLVCLGFPLTTLAGPRGRPGDPLLDIRSPALFVVGEKATTCQSDDMEDMRERLAVETGLVIVGGADDNLRLSKRKKKAECVTQSMVDRCILDEVRDFLVSTLTSSLAPRPTINLAGLLPQASGATFAVPSHDSFIAGVPRKVRARKRNSSASNDGSGPASPKRSRPATPGSAPTSLTTTPVKMFSPLGRGLLTAGPSGTTPIRIVTPAPSISPPGQATTKKARKPRKKLVTTGDPADPTQLPIISLQPMTATGDLVSLPSVPLPISLPTIPLASPLPTISISAPLPLSSLSVCLSEPLPLSTLRSSPSDTLLANSPLLSSALQTPLTTAPSLLPRYPTMVSRGRPPSAASLSAPRVTQYTVNGRGRGVRPRLPHLSNILHGSTVSNPPNVLGKNSQKLGTYSLTTAPTWSVGGSRPITTQDLGRSQGGMVQSQRGMAKVGQGGFAQMSQSAVKMSLGGIGQMSQGGVVKESGGPLVQIKMSHPGGSGNRPTIRWPADSKPEVNDKEKLYIITVPTGKMGDAKSTGEAAISVASLLDQSQRLSTSSPVRPASVSPVSAKLQIAPGSSRPSISPSASQSKSPVKFAPTSPKPGQNSPVQSLADRQDVAQILASLSGFVPDSGVQKQAVKSLPTRVIQQTGMQVKEQQNKTVVSSTQQSIAFGQSASTAMADAAEGLLVVAHKSKPGGGGRGGLVISVAETKTTAGATGTSSPAMSSNPLVFSSAINSPAISSAVTSWSSMSSAAISRPTMSTAVTSILTMSTAITSRPATVTAACSRSLQITAVKTAQPVVNQTMGKVEITTVYSNASNDMSKERLTQSSIETLAGRERQRKQVHCPSPSVMEEVKEDEESHSDEEYQPKHPKGGIKRKGKASPPK